MPDGLPAIVTSEIDDPVLPLEAEQLGATYASLPTTSEELVAAISRTILQAGGSDPVRPPFERRQGERRGSEARTHGIDGRSLNAWRVNLSRRGVPRTRALAPRLVELVPATLPVPSTVRYVLHVNGVELAVGDDFNEVGLRGLVTLLKSC